jgi:hypothetical protein
MSLLGGASALANQNSIPTQKHCGDFLASTRSSGLLEYRSRCSTGPVARHAVNVNTDGASIYLCYFLAQSCVYEGGAFPAQPLSPSKGKFK